MPAQFVQGAGPSNDFGNLLAQTISAVARQTEDQRRRRAQAALMQQMVDRGEINVGDGVKFTDNGMVFANERSRNDYLNAVNPEQQDLTRDEATYSRDTLLDKSEDIDAQVTANQMAARREALGKQLETADHISDLIQTEYVAPGGSAAGNMVLRQGALSGPNGFNPNAPGAVPPVTANSQAALNNAVAATNPLLGNAAQTLQNLGVTPPGAPPSSSFTSPSSATAATPSTTATSTTPPEAANQGTTTRVRTSAKGEDAQSRVARVLESANNTYVQDITGPKISNEVTDRKRTDTQVGVQFYDEIKETLPSLRRAAAIESIAAMAGGPNAAAPGQYAALATQREKDLATFNERLGKRAQSSTVSGGLTKTNLEVGQIRNEAKSAISGSSINMTNISNKLSASGAISHGNDDGGGNAAGKELNIQGFGNSRIQAHYDGDNVVTNQSSHIPVGGGLVIPDGNPARVADIADKIGGFFHNYKSRKGPNDPDLKYDMKMFGSKKNGGGQWDGKTSVSISLSDGTEVFKIVNEGGKLAIKTNAGVKIPKVLFDQFTMNMNAPATANTTVTQQMSNP